MAEARCKIGAGDVQEGIKLIEDIGKDKSYHDVLNLLSAFYFMSEEYKKAEEIMQRIINDEHLYYNNLACIQYKLNNFSKALNNLNRAIELDEENSTYFDNLGVIKLENNKEEKALDDFSKAIRIDGEDAVAWYYKALTMKILGRDGWKESLDMALNIQPDYEVARELRGK
jgi:tetratricopeptide (TPR) repeat protein